MRKAKYDLRQVICPNSSGLGYSSNVARPGYWIAWREGGDGPERLARVLGRIAETDKDGKDCRGYIAAMALSCEATHAGVRWIDRTDVTACYENPPAALLAWLTGSEWVKSKKDIARLVAMSEHGTTSESFISTRDDPEKAYNARPEYVAQFILK